MYCYPRKFMEDTTEKHSIIDLYGGSVFEISNRGCRKRFLAIISFLLWRLETLRKVGTGERMTNGITNIKSH